MKVLQSLAVAILLLQGLALDATIRSGLGRIGEGVEDVVGGSLDVVAAPFERYEDDDMEMSAQESKKNEKKDKKKSKKQQKKESKKRARNQDVA